MAVNVANASVICLVTWTQVSHAFLMGWTAAVVGLAVLGWHGWIRGRVRGRVRDLLSDRLHEGTRPRTAASVRAMRHAVVQASLLAALWALCR